VFNIGYELTIVLCLCAIWSEQLRKAQAAGLLRMHRRGDEQDAQGAAAAGSAHAAGAADADQSDYDVDFVDEQAGDKQVGFSMRCLPFRQAECARMRSWTPSPAASGVKANRWRSAEPA